MYTEESCRLACVGGVRGCRAGGGSWLPSGSDSAALLLPPFGRAESQWRSSNGRMISFHGLGLEPQSPAL